MSFQLHKVHNPDRVSVKISDISADFSADVNNGLAVPPSIQCNAISPPFQLAYKSQALGKVSALYQIWTDKVFKTSYRSV